MKIVTVSDLHSQYKEIDMPEGDVLVVAGDITGNGTAIGISLFNDWLGTLDYEHKIVVAGNHDWFFEDHPSLVGDFLDNAIYLQDSDIVIDGVKFYGSPWQPEFCDWAFNLPRGEPLAEKWREIPEDTDVLITHGPPHTILDSSIAPDDPSVNFGCEELYKRVMEVKPTYHIFGHIHGSYGQQAEEHTTFVNTSICTEEYKPTNKPWVLEI